MVSNKKSVIVVVTAGEYLQLSFELHNQLLQDSQIAVCRWLLFVKALLSSFNGQMVSRHATAVKSPLLCNI